MPASCIQALGTAVEIVAMLGPTSNPELILIFERQDSKYNETGRFGNKVRYIKFYGGLPCLQSYQIITGIKLVSIRSTA